MNVIGTGLIDDWGLASLVADVSAFITDADTATSIQWHNSGTTRGYDPKAGTVAYTETNTTISVWLSDLTLDRNAPPEAQIGDVQVLIRHADLTTAPTTSDRFLSGSTPYQVYRCVSGPVSTHFLVYAHRS
jgi:hypothetical protein